MLVDAIAAQGLSLGAAAIIAHAVGEEAEGLVLEGRRPRSSEWCERWFDAIEEIADCARDLVSTRCTLTPPNDLRTCSLYRHWPADDVEVGLLRAHPELRLFAVAVRRDSFEDPTVFGPESEEACLAWIEAEVGPLGSGGP